MLPPTSSGTEPRPCRGPHPPSTLSPSATPGAPRGTRGPEHPLSPLPPTPRLQPEVSMGMGPHLEGIRDLPRSQTLPGPGPGGAVGRGGLAAMVEPRVTAPGQHPDDPSSPPSAKQMGRGPRPFPPGKARWHTHVGRGRLRRAGWALEETGMAACASSMHSTRNPTAPTTQQHPLPRSPGHPKPVGLTQQRLSPPAPGCPWARGDARGGEGRSQPHTSPPCWVSPAAQGDPVAPWGSDTEQRMR